jgi:hypothetical protein
LRALIRGIDASVTRDHRRLGMLLLGLVIAQLVLGFFTMPFFARHNLYPVSVLLGVSLRYIRSPTDFGQATPIREAAIGWR